MTLPSKYRWLENEGAPKILVEALKTHGVKEVPGKADNPEILRWARVAGLGTIYQHDETAWCGLAVAYWSVMAGYKPPANPLWALNWQTWGSSVLPKLASLGDVLVFKRKTSAGWAGHVGLYAGETGTHYAVLGGNQSDQVNVSLIAKDRLVAVRRSPWKVAQPSNVRPIRLSGAGTPITTNEA